MRYWIITFLVIIFCLISIVVLCKKMNKNLELLLKPVVVKTKKTCYVCKTCGCPCFRGEYKCPDCLTILPKDW